MNDSGNDDFSVKNLGEVEVYYEMLERGNQADINGAVDCLAECFVGVEVNGFYKSDPMIEVVGLEKSTVVLHFEHLIDEIIDEGYCYVAKDKKTDRVVAAMVSEPYNPNFEPPIFTYPFEKYNDIYRYLGELNTRFRNTYKKKVGTSIRENQFLHFLDVGIKVKAKNSNIFGQFINLISEKAQLNNLDAIVCEATNNRSQIPLMGKYGFENLRDETGEPILKKYEGDPVFGVISKELAEDCKFLYKPIKLRL